MNTTTTRAELKARAKSVLKTNYWYSFGVCILMSVIIGIANSIASIFTGSGTENVGLLILSSLITIAATLFVSFPLSIGLNRYFIKTAQGNESQVKDLFYVYKNGLGNVIITLIKQAIFIFLWSLLFVIPGIIKSFQYFMIDYMLADNPGLDNKRAFEITKAAMKGNKWKTFVLGLSFILWILLGTVTFGIGLLFLEPYMQATYAQFYLDLKATAIEQGIATSEELIG